MKILAVDTALGACSVAVLDGDLVRAHRFEPMERGHAEALAPMVQEAMREAALDFDELERLAVTTGPGTFTGQRVGLAFMRGLRVALKLPLIGITTLHAMAAAAIAETGAQFAAALHDAKRTEVYFALYSRQETVIEPALLPLDRAVDEIGRAVLGRADACAFAGTAASLACERFRLLGGRADLSSVMQPDALWVGRLAAGAESPGQAPRPLYLRPADARLPVRSS
jgi:tRNA threonylcarbamoyladenosine biosynthesis protein TsaB